MVDEERIPDLEKIIDDVTQPYIEKGIIKLNSGKKIFEVKPAEDWDKGKAVSLLRKIVHFEEESLPIYIGDDITDEDAFYELRKEGIGILVSEEERETAADFILKDVQEVQNFLENLLELLRNT
jgi:trehalose-phosphatase